MIEVEYIQLCMEIKKENILLWLGYSYGYSLVNFIKRNNLINIDELTKKDRNFFDNYNKKI